MNDAIATIYSKQLGGELPYFAGSTSQWGGGGILSTIARFAFPILKRLVCVAMNTGEDVLEGKKTFKDSLIDNTMKEVRSFIPSEPVTSINRKRTSTQKYHHQPRKRDRLDE